MSSSDQSAPILCRNCSVFYGAARFDNYCSKCYHDLFGAAVPKTPVSANELSTTSSEVSSASEGMQGVTPSSPAVAMKASQPIEISSPKASSAYGSSPSLKVSSSLPASTFASSMMEVDSNEASPGNSPASFGEGGFLRKKKNQCFAPGCKKKLGLTAVECHCGHSFCGDHRYADKHNCTYDYKGKKTESLSKALPMVAPRKVAEI